MSNLIPKSLGMLGKMTGWSKSKQQRRKPPRKRTGDAEEEEDEDNVVSKRKKTGHRGPGPGDSDEAGDSDSFETLVDSDDFEGRNSDDDFPRKKDSEMEDSEMKDADGFSEDADSDGFSEMDFTPEDTAPAQASMEKQFGNPRGITFQGVIGRGENAIAALLHDSRVTPPRRLILKRPLRKDDLSAIKNEIKVLQVLRGAAHTVQLLNANDRAFDDPGLPGTSIALEYVENGSFTRLLERCNEAGVRVPNRVLWSIMLCLIRACVGLTWPARSQDREPAKLETIPRKRKPTPYAHNDLHVDNIMFGNMEPDLAEHCMVPPVKLIDFGQASDTLFSKGPLDVENRNPHQGEHSNAFKTAEAMMRLIAGREPMENLPTFKTKPAHLSGVETDATLLWADDEDEDKTYPKLDRPLRRLIGRMMACRDRIEANDKPKQDRPLLEDILDTASQAVRHRTEQDYPGFEEEETDEAITAFVGRFFFSPSESDEPFASEEGLITPPRSPFDSLL
ncbi:hypothetical protein PG991_007096 [Apiospora marii]|uniref:Protein kinase domain-containing protein n=1 Tax=Apiospora marii TaxID=335849 RepID=A0ABR1RSG2_9PEZI